VARGLDVSIIDTATGTVRSTVDLDQIATAMTLGPDGSIVAAADADGAVRVVSMADGAVLQRFTHPGLVRALDIDGTSARLLVAGEDRSARVWDLSSGEELSVLKEMRAVTSAQFSPDGRFVVTLTADGVRLQPWDPDVLLRLACDRVGRDLTPEEWRQYIPEKEQVPVCPTPARSRSSTTRSSDPKA
jgi:WD40 repeat protein